MAEDKFVGPISKWNSSTRAPYSVVGGQLTYIGCMSGFRGELHKEFLDKRFSKVFVKRKIRR